MIDEIRVCKAVEKDLDCILSLYKEQNWLGKNQTLSKTKKIFIENKSDTMFLVAKLPGGEIVGTVTASINQALAFDCKKYMVFDYLVVDKNYRRQGVAKCLISYLIDYAKKHNLESIWFCSSASKTEAHLFYQKMGFDDPVKGFRKSF